jgi:hypothetical protein
MDIFLPTTPIYALLVWYCVWNWRQLRPLSSFRAQVPRLGGAVVRFGIAWLVLTFGLHILTELLCSANCDAQVLFWVTLLPFLPMYMGLFLINLFVPPDLPSAVLVAACVFYGGEVALALLLLLLVSFVEWWILRVRSRRPAAA